MSTTPKKTTLTLDDIQMIGELVEDSERRILSKVATKEDLKSFATKEDLKSFATKEDLRTVVRKEDLESIVENVVGRVVEQKFKEVIGSFPNKDQFHAQMASQAATVEKVDQEQIVLTYQVQKIDSRVSILEEKALT